MKEMTIAYLVLLSVLLVSIGGVSYALWPQSIPFDGGATGLFLLEKPEQSIAEEQPATQELESACVAGLPDNCPYDYNPDQADADGDGLGDVCDNEFNPPSGPACGEAIQEVPPQQPLTGSAASETEDSSILVALASIVMLMVLLMGVASIFREKISAAYHKARARVKFHLKK